MYDVLALFIGFVTALALGFFLLGALLNERN
jgi:hypothetical protein